MITEAYKLKTTFFEHLGRGYTVRHQKGNWIFKVDGVLISLSEDLYLSLYQ